MIVLGLNAFGHDAAAVLLVDGRTVFASSEERYDRRRHSGAFPRRSIRAALEAASVSPADVDHIAFPWSSGMARGRKAAHVLTRLPRSLAFLRERPHDDLPGRVSYLQAMKRLPATLAAEGLTAPLSRVPHHRAHAASARLALPGGRGAVITADGMGEWTTTGRWHATDDGLVLLDRAAYPHSAGKAYAAVTQWLGFWPESDEGKTMGLAPYGRTESEGARFARSLLTYDAKRILRVRERAFGFPWGYAQLYGDAFGKAIGSARDAEEALRPTDADVARGIQDAVEDVFLRAARDLLERTSAPALGLAGGLFLNCALNGRLLRELEVPVYPFPVAGDAGAAWGAATDVHERESGTRPAPLTTLHLGHDLTAAEVRAATDGAGTTSDDLAAEVAKRIAAGRLVGVARGRAEFGPRALGARSIFASPTTTATRDRLNEHKGRESWRPLAPVLHPDDHELFAGLVPSPWMILTFESTPVGRERVAGGIHVDGTARVQTVEREGGSFVSQVIGALEARGEPPAVLNTSFNRRGEPIVNDAEQALTSARAMRLDTVVLGDRLLDLSP